MSDTDTGTDTFFFKGEGAAELLLDIHSHHYKQQKYLFVKILDLKFEDFPPFLLHTKLPNDFKIIEGKSYKLNIKSNI